jgi:penicillin-binding protein 1A
LVTGVWVGCDERSVHFKTSQTGEGSRTALPIFGKFMEKVYKDASLGIKPGPFPKPGVEITREYQCETVYSRPDTSAIDSAFIDSLYIPSESPDTVEAQNLTIRSTPSPKVQENKANQIPENKQPANPKTETPIEAQKTRKEIREERRQNKAKQNN